MSSNLRLFISAGEVSGDKIASSLAEEIQKQNSDVEIVGVGGESMRESSVVMLDEIAHYSSTGILETISPKTLKRLVYTYNKVTAYLLANKIDAVIMVDNQGFNLRLSEFCKKNGILNIYYFPPHVSVWGKWNIKSLKKNCDLLVVPFKEDANIYEKYLSNFIYSGHPFADIKPPPSEFNKDRIKKVGVFFGSRKQELSTLGKIFVKSIILLNKKLNGNVKFIIPIAASAFSESVKKLIEHLPSCIKTEIVETNTQSVYESVDACILASGTASLLSAVYGKPMVICYKINPLTYLIGKMIVKGGMIGMPNIMLGKRIVAEFLQGKCNAENISNEIYTYLSDEALYKKTSLSLSKVREMLGEECAVKRVANIVLDAASKKVYSS